MDTTDKKDISLIIKMLIGVDTARISEDDDSRYHYTAKEYITREEIGIFLNDLSGLPESINEETVSEALDETGIVRSAYDEYHFPPLPEKGYSPETIEFVKFCLGIMLERGNYNFSRSDIYKMINYNIEEFMPLDKDVYEPSRITEEQAEKVYNIIHSL